MIRDPWLRALSDCPIPEQIDLAAASGFGAVYIDRAAYADRGLAIEGALRDRLGGPIVVSSDGRLAAYRMRAAGTTPVPLATLLPKWQTPIRFDQETLPPRIARITGFSHAESSGRWTDGAVARIEFLTPLPRRFVLRIETSSAMPPSANVDLPIRVAGASRTIRVVNAPTIAEAAFDLPRDDTVIEIGIPNPASPRDFDIGPDTRGLGIHVKSITILPN